MSLFFSVRRIVRTKLAAGKKYDPSAWLRVETLKFIADSGEPKMKDVADYLSITAPSATSLIGGLMRSGLVASATDKRDRRTLRLTLTVKGRRELKRSLARGMEILGGLFATLSEKELAAFTDALEQLKGAADE